MAIVVKAFSKDKLTNVNFDAINWYAWFSVKRGLPLALLLCLPSEGSHPSEGFQGARSPPEIVTKCSSRGRYGGKSSPPVEGVATHEVVAQGETSPT